MYSTWVCISCPTVRLWKCLVFRNTGAIKGLETKCEEFNSCCRFHPQSELICCVNLRVGDFTYSINEQYEEVE